MSKCWYTREAENMTYSPSCQVEYDTDYGLDCDHDVHPQDIDGKYCTFCGRKIKIKEFTSMEPH